MGLFDTIGTVARGVNTALEEGDRLRMQELDQTAKQLEAMRKTETHERGIAKERLGIARTDAQAAITGGNYQRADEVMRPQLGNYNTVMGTNNVGDKLIGTPVPGSPDLRPESIPGVVNRPKSFGMQGLPGASERQSVYGQPMGAPVPGAGFGAPREASLDDSRPDYANPANRSRIESRAGYVPPKPEGINLSYGQERWERQRPGDPYQKVAEASDKPGVVNRPPKLVPSYGPDGKITYVEAAPGLTVGAKPEREATGYQSLMMMQNAQQARQQWGHNLANFIERGVSDFVRNNTAKGYGGKETPPSADVIEAERARLEATYLRRNPEPQMPAVQNPNSPSASAGGTARWAPIIEQASQTYGVPVAIIQAVMGQESGGANDATSPVGAAGLMQLMPGTAKQLGVTNVRDPQQNIMAGVNYLRQQYDKFKRWDHALAAYNAGPGAVEKYGGIPPYKETQDYVTRIMARVNGQQKPAPARPHPSHPAFKPIEVTPEGGKKRSLQEPPAKPARTSPFGKSSAITPALAAFYGRHGITPGEA